MVTDGDECWLLVIHVHGFADSAIKHGWEIPEVEVSGW